jgi:hypothetical protein
MSSRALRYLLVLLAALAVLYAILTLSGRADSSDPAGPVAVALEDLRAADVTGIDILGPAGESVALARTDEGWTANGFGADSAAIQRMLTASGEAKAGDRVSTNPANHERLGVTSDSAWHVTFSLVTGTETGILLGKPGPSFNAAYIRLPEQDDVYLVTGDLRAAAARPLDEWRDKLIAAVDTTAVDAIHLERDSTRYSIIRTDSAWTMAGLDLPADPAAMGDLLGELSDLRATGFFDQGLAESADDGGPVLLRLVAVGAAADTLLELEAAEREAAYQVRAVDATAVYQLPAWRVDRLIPAHDRLVPNVEQEAEPSS